MQIFLTVSHIRPNEALHAYELLQLNPSFFGDTIKIFKITIIMNPKLDLN